MPEVFEFFSGDRDFILVFYLALILLPAEQGFIPEERGCKRYFVLAYGTSGCKMVLALLKEIIVIQVGLTPVNVWKASFQRPLTRDLCGRDPLWMGAFVSGAMMGAGIKGGRSLDSKTVLRMHWRLFSEYLTMEVSIVEATV